MAHSKSIVAMLQLGWRIKTIVRLAKTGDINKDETTPFFTFDEFVRLVKDVHNQVENLKWDAISLSVQNILDRNDPRQTERIEREMQNFDNDLRDFNILYDKVMSMNEARRHRHTLRESRMPRNWVMSLMLEMNRVR